MPRVPVVFTGGTISMRHDPLAGGNVPALDGAAILARTPGLEALATVEAIDLGLTPASHFTFPTLIEIADMLRGRLADPDVAGAVVVQGTDTIEETAFAWDLLLDGPKPVVVTGAMRTPDRSDYDGPGKPARRRCGGGIPGVARAGSRGVTRRFARGGRRCREAAHVGARHVPEPELGIARAGGGAGRLARAAARPAAARVGHAGRGTGPPRDGDGGHGRVVDRRGRERRCRCDRRRGHRGGQYLAGGSRGRRARDGGRHSGGPRIALHGRSRDDRLRVPWRRRDVGTSRRDRRGDAVRA